MLWNLDWVLAKNQAALGDLGGSEVYLTRQAERRVVSKGVSLQHKPGGEFIPFYFLIVLMAPAGNGVGKKTPQGL